MSQQLIEDLKNNLTNTLLAAQSHLVNIRDPATAQLKKWGDDNMALFLLALSYELANEQKQGESRVLAGILLKNTLDAKDAERRKDLQNKWLALDQDTRMNIKQISFNTLASPVEQVRTFAAQVVSKVAIIELPKDMWPGLIEALLNNMRNENPHIRQSTVLALGDISEHMVGANTLSDNVANNILAAVVHGMIPEEKDRNVKLAACSALFYGLGFVKRHFGNQAKRDHIMNVVIDCCSFADDKVRIAAYEILVRIAARYYEYLPEYMVRIFNLTLNSIKTEKEDVAQQAVEFWSTLCDEEMTIMEEISEHTSFNMPPPRECKGYIKAAVKFLVPVLTEAMTKQEDDADPEDWNLAMAAGSCLNLCANTVEDEIVPHVMPFIQNNIHSNDWKFKEAALFAFGSIMEGPMTYIRTVIPSTIPFMLTTLKDNSLEVRDTTAWTLSRICHMHHQCIGSHMDSLVKALGESLNDDARVVKHVCFGILKLAAAYEEDPDNSPFTPYFTNFINALLATANKADNVGDINLRLSVYETVNAIITAASEKNYPNIEQFIPMFLQQLEATLQTAQDQTEQAAQNEVKGLLCSTLMVITQKFEYKIGPFATNIMTAYMRVFASPKGGINETLCEEAILGVGAMATALGSDFYNFMPAVSQVLNVALRNIQDYRVCDAAVGVVGDIARAIGPKIIETSDMMVHLMLEAIVSPSLERMVRQTILSTFGELASALGTLFDKYLGPVLTMLQRASEIAMSERLDQVEDDDLINYINGLREGIFEAYTGIIQGLRDSDKIGLMADFVPGIIKLISIVWQDSMRTREVTQGAVGLIGDLAQGLGKRIKPLLISDAVTYVLKTAAGSQQAQTRELAVWARDLINQM
jgi:importin subunit beta-1